MTPDSIFLFVNMIALPMWILMIFLPKLKLTRFLIDFKIVPVLLTFIYAIYIVQDIVQGASFDFSTLESVKTLFTNDKALLAGWIHYLAFDLIVGMWILDKNKELEMHKLLIDFCLLATFMFGPLGFLLFMIFKTLKQSKSSVK